MAHFYTPTCVVCFASPSRHPIGKYETYPSMAVVYKGSSLCPEHFTKAMRAEVVYEWYGERVAEKDL